LCDVYVYLLLGMESTTYWLWRSSEAFPDNRQWKKPRIF